MEKASFKRVLRHRGTEPSTTTMQSPEEENAYINGPAVHYSQELCGSLETL